MKHYRTFLICLLVIWVFLIISGLDDKADSTMLSMCFISELHIIEIIEKDRK